jgi:hypothetical protein
MHHTHCFVEDQLKVVIIVRTGESRIGGQTRQSLVTQQKRIGRSNTVQIRSDPSEQSLGDHGTCLSYCWTFRVVTSLGRTLPERLKHVCQKKKDNRQKVAIK